MSKSGSKIREQVAHFLVDIHSDSLEVEFVLETVNNLIRDHGSSLRTETIIHSDQGCHYTSYDFAQILHDKALRQSMSRKGKLLGQCTAGKFLRPYERPHKGETEGSVQF